MFLRVAKSLNILDFFTLVKLRMIDLSSTLFVVAPSWRFKHYKTPFLLLLTISFILPTVFPAYSSSNKLETAKDTLGAYVKKQLKEASIAKNKDWSKAIAIMDGLQKDSLVLSNDSILNYVKYRHSLYLLMVDENIRSKEMILEILEYHEIHNRKRWTNLKSRLGTLSMRLGDYELAMMHLEEALPYAKQLEMNITEGLIYLYISNICRFKSDFGEAYRKADIALQIFKKINREDWISEAQTSLAYISVLAKDYEGAAVYFEDIFSKAAAISDDNFLVSPTLYAGIMNFEKGDIPLAKKQLEQGLAQINALGSFPDLTIVYDYMSQISSIEQDFTAAEDYILKALAITTKSYNKRQELSARLTLLKLEAIIKPKKDNLTNLRDIYQWALENEDNILLKESSNLISAYYSKLGNFKKALAYNKIYISASEEKFQKDRLNEIALIKEKSKHAQEVKEREIKSQQLQAELSLSEADRNKMITSILFLVLMSCCLLYFYSQKQAAYFSLEISNQELKKAEHRVAQKNKKLEKYIASNLQLENFAYIASHDLKSPLQTISNFSQLLKKTAKEHLSEDELQYLTFIIKGTQDMNLLVKDLLDFSLLQKSTLTKEKIDVPRFVEYVLQLNEPLIKEKKASISLDLNTPFISGDRSKLLQLLQNLISNAVKFHLPEELPNVVISSYAEKDNWVFNIKDNGIGIEPTYFNKIFLLFKRLHRKEDYEGTGIGLSLCKKIVEMHGGKIWVNSSLGNGATFSFSLPK